MDDIAFEEMVKRLVDYRILSYDLRTGKYNTHSLIRSYYYDLLVASDRSQGLIVHKQLTEYCLSQAKNMPDNPTLDDLKPLIEAVHHACRSGFYYEAQEILWEKIYQRDKFYLLHKLGAYQTNLTILREFFLEGDTSQDPLVCSTKGWMLNDVGLCLMILGRLDQAEQFFERAKSIYLDITKDRIQA